MPRKLAGREGHQVETNRRIPKRWPMRRQIGPGPRQPIALILGNRLQRGQQAGAPLDLHDRQDLGALGQEVDLRLCPWPSAR